LCGDPPGRSEKRDQQAITALHRMRSQWMATRTARINAIRGVLSEFGVSRATGASRFLRELPVLLQERSEEIPPRVRTLILATLRRSVRWKTECGRPSESWLRCFRKSRPSLALQQIP
jgi:transposase